MAKESIGSEIKQYQQARIKKFLIELEQEKISSAERQKHIEDRINLFSEMTVDEATKAYYSDYR